MKSFVLALMGTLFCSALWADEEDAFYAPCDIISLGTNTACKVKCQIRYENLVEVDPSDVSEQTRNDKNVNLGLESFLKELCNSMTDDERVRYFAQGDIQGCVYLDFGTWLDDRAARINKRYGETVIDVRIYDVKMQAVGVFADMVAAEEE